MTLQLFVWSGSGYSHCAVPTVFSKRLAQRSGNNRGRCLLVIGTLPGKSRGESMILPVAVALTTKPAVMVMGLVVWNAQKTSFV